MDRICHAYLSLEEGEYIMPLDGHTATLREVKIWATDKAPREYGRVTEGGCLIVCGETFEKGYRFSRHGRVGPLLWEEKY